MIEDGRRATAFVCSRFWAKPPFTQCGQLSASHRYTSSTMATPDLEIDCVTGGGELGEEAHDQVKMAGGTAIAASYRRCTVKDRVS